MVDDFRQECLTHSQELWDAVQTNAAFLLEQGNQAREPVSKPLGDGIFELRARHGTLRARLLYYFSKERRLIVFVYGLVKKTLKVDPAAIRLAKKRRNEIEQGEPTYDTKTIHTIH